MCFNEEEVRLDCLQDGCPNPKKHLYFNVVKGVGYCHRCNSSMTLKELICSLNGTSIEDASSMIEGVGVNRIVRLQNRLKLLKERGKVEESCPSPVSLPSGFRVFTPEEAETHFYLKKRKIPRDTVLNHRMGYCLTGRWADRLIIPLYQRGELMGFIGRSFFDPPSSLSPIGKKIWARANSYVKVLNVKGFNSSKLLFNYDRFGEEVIVTEGVFDALRCGPSGTALFGKRMSSYQEGLLKEKNPEKVYILLDRDAYKEAREIAFRLSKIGLNVYLGRLTKVKDPGKLLKDQIDEVLKNSERISPMRFFSIKKKIKRLNL